MWYGPGLIGATMGYDAFYRFHEHPWEDAIAPRGPTPTKEDKHVTRFGDGAYCSFTGWPSIRATVRGDFLGLPNPAAPVDIRVMDFYRRKGERLIENWIFIDMPHLFLQLGIDLIARMGKGGLAARSAPLDQARAQDHVLGLLRLAVDLVEEDAHRGGHHLRDGLADRGQVIRGLGGHRHVVEPDHGHVLRHPQAKVEAHHVQRADRHVSLVMKTASGRSDGANMARVAASVAARSNWPLS